MLICKFDVYKCKGGDREEKIRAKKAMKKKMCVQNKTNMLKCTFYNNCSITQKKSNVCIVSG